MTKEGGLNIDPPVFSRRWDRCYAFKVFSPKKWRFLLKIKLNHAQFDHKIGF
jgi:hypothetical protein